MGEPRTLERETNGIRTVATVSGLVTVHSSVNLLDHHRVTSPAGLCSILRCRSAVSTALGAAPDCSMEKKEEKYTGHPPC